MLSMLLLFDIDGTLISGARSARTAFARTMEEVLNVAVDLRRLESAGKTDYRIMRDILDAHGVAADRVDWDRLRAAFFRHVEDAVRLEPGRVCPGVRPLLDALSRRSDVVLALGTGNLERSARLKLGVHDLNRYFATGGFGDDGVNRDEVIVAGIARCEAQHALRFDRIAVVGDTPADVACAQAAGVHGIAVATGPYSTDALRQAGASAVFEDFTMTEAVIRAIDALPPPSLPPG